MKDKNKGLAFDDDEDDGDDEGKMVTRPKKEWDQLQKKLSEQSQRLAHLEEKFKGGKRLSSSDERDQNGTEAKRQKAD